MTIDATITCPNCQTEIKLTESLAAPLIAATKREYEKKIADKDAALDKREAELRRQQDAVKDAQANVETLVAEKLKSERGVIAADEARKAKLQLGADLEVKAKEISELKDVLLQRDTKLAEAQAAQAELLRKQRELDDAKRELELSVEKRVQEALSSIREQAKKEAEDGLRLKVSEKEEQILSMQRQIEELRRRAEQGSQQLQGEVLELQLETVLANRFPLDILEPVAKGEFGGDVLQRVIGPTGQACGAILWETKRTKNWSDGWLPKLRGDQRAAKAELALLVSEVLPKNVESFELVDGVWITHPRYTIPVASVLRQSLIELAAARLSQDGQLTKTELVYQYLTGPRFRHRVEAIVERFSEMQDDLNRERKATMRLWAKREAQIQGVIDSTVGMYGDLQGIAGRAMQEIPALETPLIEDKEE
ncbi:DUF2130 domain-containing protein [Bradyrhizobium manausense]|jgi:hypothetical protein|uniref:DUF2130 domain-containing protein n=2 Tax=Pseudomonadota TaxID=1224 RepID=UPI001BA66170|nr:DUF2130 domain-containing protein [Bradyrhizobium manausense]MBR1090266.1 DUF2130 domain-containing protein [Bradyrhizobium manausense]